MKRLARDAILIICFWYAFDLFFFILDIRVGDAGIYFLFLIVLCAYPIYRCFEDTQITILLLFLLSIGLGIGRGVSRHLVGYENRLIEVLFITLAYVFHRYLTWIFSFMHSQTSPTLGMGNISLLECLWPPLYQRRLNRVLDAVLEEEANKSDEGILGQREE
jgi:hypothetical protein